MTASRSLPGYAIREAAELLAARIQVDRLLRGDHNGGPTIKDYLIRVSRAKGAGEFFHHIPAARRTGMRRPLTICVKSYNGSYRACVLPNLVSQETALSFLDRTDGGLLDRERVWGDPRFIGLASQCFGPSGPNCWWDAHPERGLAARAAYAALLFEGLRKDVTELSPKTDLVDQLRHNLLEVERETSQPDQKATFSSAADSYASCWTVEVLDKILGLRDAAELQPARPPTVPLDLFRHRGKLGYGEIIAYWLTRDPQGPGLSQTEAANTMGLENRKAASRLATTAKRKLGPKRSLLQLTPAFPAGSQSSSDLRGETSAHSPPESQRRRGGERMAKGKGQGSGGGWPSGTGKPSGGGRSNNSPKGK